MSFTLANTLTQAVFSLQQFEHAHIAALQLFLSRDYC